MRHPIMIAALTLTLAACTQASVPPAGTLAYGLNASGQLVTFGLDNAGSSATTRSVTGLGSDTLADLDFNPANGALYAFATSGNVYTVDPATGAATLNTTPLSTVAPRVTDFNPAANRVRVIGASSSNARLTVDPGPSTSPKGTVTTDGTLAYAATDTNAGKTPNVLGAAYTNSALNGGTLPASTLLYSVDATTNTLDLHSTAPGTAAGNFNTLGTVGALGVTLGSSVGFDIVTRGGMNTAYLVNGSTLYTVNLTTGAATQIAMLSTPLKALAVTLSAQ